MSNIEYTSKDYGSLRQDLLDSIPAIIPEWTSRSSNDFGIVLVEMFSYLGDILSYYQDRIANEAYLGTAVRRESLLALAALLDYAPSGVQPSQTTMQFVATAGTYIPAGTQVSTEIQTGTSPLVYETDEHLTLPAAVASTTTTSAAPTHSIGDTFSITVASASGFPTTNGYRFTLTASALTEIFYVISGAGTIILEVRSESTPIAAPIGSSIAVAIATSGTITASQGETLTDEALGQSTGQPNQIFPLYRSPVLDGSVVVKVAASSSASDGVEWTYIRHLVDAAASDSVYSTFEDEDGVTYIQFGDSVSGRIPPNASYIFSTYRVGEGVGGNTAAGQVTRLVTSVSGVTAVTNTTAALFGADRESDDSIRVNAPKTFASQDRAVTTDDYARLATRSGFAARASAVATAYTSVQVYPVATGGSPIALIVGSTSAYAAGTAYRPGDYVLYLGATYRCIALSTGNLPSNVLFWELCSVMVDLKTLLQTYLDNRSMIGANVTLIDPKWRPININAVIECFDTASRVTTRLAVASAMENYLSLQNIEFGQKISRSAIYSVINAVPGVRNLSLDLLSTTGGNYSATVTYLPGDYVLSGAVYYRCILTTVGNAPPNATYWTALAATEKPLTDITLGDDELPVAAAINITADPTTGV